MRLSLCATAVAAACCFAVPTGHAQEALRYQQPPALMQALLDAPVTPVALLSPDRATMLVQQPATYPTVADVGQPRFRLAGLRFNPQSNGSSSERYMVGLQLQVLRGCAARPVTGQPAQLQATNHYALVSELHRPFSPCMPSELFPMRTSVIDLRTGTAQVLFDCPLLDILPVAFNAVPVGLRAYEWRSDVPATLCCEGTPVRVEAPGSC